MATTRTTTTTTMMMMMMMTKMARREPMQMRIGKRESKDPQSDVTKLMADSTSKVEIFDIES
jgi:hypothetical protein